MSVSFAYFYDCPEVAKAHESVLHTNSKLAALSVMHNVKRLGNTLL